MTALDPTMTATLHLHRPDPAGVAREAGDRVVTMDVRGHGETPALWAAHDAPARVRGVVLPGPIVCDLPAPGYVRAALAVGFAGPWRVAFWMACWNSLLPSRQPRDPAVARSALAGNLHEPGRMEALRAMVGRSKADTEGAVARSRVPARVVMGTRDPDVPDAAAEARGWAGPRARSRCSSKAPGTLRTWRCPSTWRRTCAAMPSMTGAWAARNGSAWAVTKRD